MSAFTARVVDSTEGTEARQHRHFVVSASLLKGLKHANIVTLHDIIHTKDTLTFVFEFVVSLHEVSPFSQTVYTYTYIVHYTSALDVIRRRMLS